MKSSRCVLSAFLFMVAFGCAKESGTPPQDDKLPKKLSPAEADLTLFASAYRFYSDANQVPPRGLDDLKKHFSSDRPIDFNRYVIIWGVDVLMVQDARILAYEIDAPTKGGMIALTDTSVKSVTADEFNRMPKAIPAKTK